MMPCYQDMEHLCASTLFRIVIACLLFVVSFSLVLFCVPRNAYSVDISLAWDANTEPDLAGYRIFYKAGVNDYDYTTPAWEGTDTTCIITGLDDDLSYCFVARAFDTSGLESENSNEVCYSSTSNNPPVANAGVDRSVNEGTVVTLDGTGSSDPDGSIDEYQWTQIPASTVTLVNADTSQPSFTAPQVGVSGTSLTFRLEVTDNGGLTDTDEVIITVADITPVNEPPVANAGIDQRVCEKDTVTLDAGGSYDPDGDIVTYLWVQTGGTPVLNFDGTTMQVTFTAPNCGPIPEIFSFILTVTDDEGLQSSDACAIEVYRPLPNLAPYKPKVKKPKDKDLDCMLMTEISTESYTDPEEDPHGETNWQISTEEDFSTLALDIDTSERLEDMTVPHLVLEEDTTYYTRVRFRDVYEATSEWSDPVSFTTQYTGSDADGNGIPDDKEVVYTTDINDDGIVDADQPEVIKCIQLSDLSTVIGVCKVSDSITAIEAVDTIDLESIPDDGEAPADLSLGLFSYQLLVDEPGAMALIRVYFSEDISEATTFYKYDTINGWQEFTDNISFNEDGRSITIAIEDGGLGDSDGVANGIITDPGGLVVFGNGSYIADNASRDSAGGCFLSASEEDQLAP
ncbi:MAG: PKD domain-containing protein [bacterium]